MFIANKLESNSMFNNVLKQSKQQLAALFEHFCAKLLSDCKEFNPEFFSCTTTRYLLGQHVKISGAFLCILLVIFVRNVLQSM